jgi:hypothetical protein
MNIFPYICDIPTSIFHIPTLKTLNKTVERAGRGGGGGGRNIHSHCVFVFQL